MEPMASPLELEEENLSYALQLVTSSALPMSLKCAMDLGIFDILAKAGPGAKLSPIEIAAKLPIINNPDAPSTLDCILRLLASHSVLSCSVIDDNGSDFRRLYGLLPVSKFFVTNKDGVSLCPLLPLLQDDVYSASWSRLKDAILEGGIPFNRAHGMHVFEYPGVDPRFNHIFNNAMYNLTSIFVKKMLEVYKGFDGPTIKQLVDVGGGLGVNLHLITETYPHIKGINFDLPRVVQHASSYPGVEHVGGDMFESVPRGDAIFMKNILHDWSDEKCIELLKNCYKAIPENGKVIVLEEVVPVMPETSSAGKSMGQVHAIMMTITEGKERSKQELLALATGAGFSGIRFQCYVCLSLVSSSALTMSMKCVITLGVFDIIAKAGPGAKPTAPQILHPIWLLDSHSVLSCSVFEENGSHFHSLYGLLPVSEHFVTSKQTQCRRRRPWRLKSARSFGDGSISVEGMVSIRADEKIHGY
ncbi:hypothetical protein FNV43_RR20494 [Rhamnella rubrinervis]|uniref:caffeate O-methyltransferase n=1 Tax=Rhamnella rubrinervis TaxID=2594499 RepID=A0A8K0DYV5_9ROSA|nr:hypothetical protein FNV43_RR20494 [Rhamnella rubrinervis]